MIAQGRRNVLFSLCFSGGCTEKIQAHKKPGDISRPSLSKKVARVPTNLPSADFKSKTSDMCGGFCAILLCKIASLRVGTAGKPVYGLTSDGVQILEKVPSALFRHPETSCKCRRSFSCLGAHGCSPAHRVGVAAVIPPQ